MKNYERYQLNKDRLKMAKKEPNEQICSQCGGPESEHHDFQPISIPEGCICDVVSWGDKISPICDAYRGNGTTYCENCEHDALCHKSDSPSLKG